MTSRYGRDGPIRVVGMVSSAHFVSHIYLLAYPPLFPLIGREFGLSTAQLGLLVTAIYVPTLCLQLPLGTVVDRIGAKQVLLGGLVVTAGAIGLSGLAPTYWSLLAFALVSGIGQSVFHPANYALLDSVTDVNSEGTAFSVHTFGGFAGFAAAPVVIGGVGIAVDWRVALLVAGSIGIVFAGVLALAMAPVHRHTIEKRNRDETGDESEMDAMAPVRELASYVRQPDLVLVAVFYLLSMVAIVGLQSFTTVLAVDTQGFSESAANTLLTAHLTCSAIGVLVGGPIADRVPFDRVIVIAFLLSATGVWLIAAGQSGVGFAASFLLFSAVGLTIGSALPSRDKFANSMADPDATGAAFGFFFTGLSLGAVLSPAILGMIIDRWSTPVAFAVIGASLVAAVAVIAVARVHQPVVTGKRGSN